MKIMYLGKFDKPYATERYVSHALQQQQGVEVSQEPLRRYKLEKAIARAKEFEADVVLFSKASANWVPGFLKWTKENDVTTVCWQWDLFWGYGRSPLPQFKSDLLFTTDGDESHAKAFKRIGANHEVLRQGIHLPEYHLIESKGYAHDVAFVGSATYQDRRRLINWLKATYGKKFVHHTKVRGKRLNEALSKVKVVVGDSYNVKNYWSNRIYEITGRGGFLLHPETIGLEDEWSDNFHYVSYRRLWGKSSQTRRDWQAYLKEKIDYWIEHDLEREAIRRQGFAHCGIRYTYEHRVKVLLDKIRSYKEEQI